MSQDYENLTQALEWSHLLKLHAAMGAKSLCEAGSTCIYDDRFHSMSFSDSRFILPYYKNSFITSSTMLTAQLGLCVYCTALFPLEDAEDTTRPFHPTWHELNEQAGSCQLCRFILTKLNSNIKLGNYRDGRLQGTPTTLSAKLRNTQLYSNGTSWAIFVVEMDIPILTRRVTQEVSITTHMEECKAFLPRPKRVH